ncbi:hypothetical protein [uncultured Gimesia sp.]|jgi:hypothetical protein|uniref:hypothetical protein n=1 Tax=uncultured Gimesia sp. TaxID=1678688 RepID=UPI00260C88C0|nr:hypothetical protein [uncultured Gimesia sp.]
MHPSQPQYSTTQPVANRFPSMSLALWFGVLAGIPLLLEAVVLLATGTMERFLWLCSQSVPGLIVAWPVSVLLLIWLCIGWSRCLERDELGSLRLLWLTPLIVLPITMLFWGALFYNPDFYSGNFEWWQLMAVHIMFLLGILLAVLAIFLNRGRQSIVAPFSLLAILIIFICAFTASSSVSGEWL